MVKKLIKKKPSTSTTTDVKKNDEDSIEMPMARRDDAEDVAEDYALLDMSNIAAPVIEFEMPNLGERKIEKAAGKSTEIETKSAKKGRGRPKKVKKDVKKDSEESEDSEDDQEEDSAPKKTAQKADNAPESDPDDLVQLTAEKLNNELVSLRPWILKARNQLTMRIVRQKKNLEKKKQEGKGGKVEDVERQLKRMGEEIVGLKTIDRDTIAKFAVLNNKNLDQLKINGSTPLSERLLYKIACHSVIVSRIREIKKKYIEWNKTAAFFMQRLGQQYANKTEKKKTPSKSDKKDSEAQKAQEDSEDSDVDEVDSDNDEKEQEEEEDSDDVETPEDYDQSDVEMVDSDEEDVGKEAAAKRRNLLLGLIGVKEDKSRPALKPKKRKLVEDDDVVATSSGASTSTAKKQKTKETVKEEMKKVLAKELKNKETKNPKPAKKVKKTPSPMKKKKAVRTPTKTSNIDENMELSESEDVVEDLSQKTLVMKINLSQGGKIAKTPKTPSVPKSKKTKKTSSREEDSDDDDESAGFFLPANTTTTPKIAKKSVKKEPEVVPYTRPLTPSQASVCKHKKQEKKAFQPPPSTTTDKKKGSSKNNASADGELHPSWIASQLKKKELAAAKPAGKRILFSDDDD